MNNRTYSQKSAEVSRDWYELDATGLPLGRLAAMAAKLLIGKHKATYTPHVDGGDYVVITNASAVILTGNKGEEEIHRHSGYPGGIKSIKKAKVLAQNPTALVSSAVRGMLPVNKLRPGRLQRLKIFAGNEHDHSAQLPKKLEVS